MRLIEHPDHFEVTCEQAEVSVVHLSSLLGLTVRERESGDGLQIELFGPFQVRDSDGGWEEIDPERDDPRLGSLALALRFAALTACTIRGDGCLELRFGGGAAIDVAPQPSNETWQLSHERFSLICREGGELAIWDHAPE